MKSTYHRLLFCVSLLCLVAAVWMTWKWGNKPAERNSSALDDVSSGQAAAGNISRPTMTKGDMVKRYQKLFGDHDFGDDRIFRHFVHLGVYYLPEAKPLEGRLVSKQLRRMTGEWFELFLTEPYRPDMAKLQPILYHLPMASESSFLVWEWSTADHLVRAVESGTAILFEIKPKDKGRMIDSVTALKAFVDDFLRTDYAVDSETIKQMIPHQFNLPENLAAVGIFTNYDGKIINDWRTSKSGFFHDQSLFLICFKKLPDTPQFGLDQDSAWLARHLYKSDGRTKVLVMKDE